ncbi:hypothetical protein GGX14DRAFT_553314 [Mycena pura]|uniref:Uncharacterized protein n=1 Tax=Mycena pura TaxID=153505 RepID=A0AAD6YUF0_9AGAR|nr:hypothetical protein GGX14DRAFT_553314 [Mycena pura]
MRLELRGSLFLFEFGYRGLLVFAGREQPLIIAIPSSISESWRARSRRGARRRRALVVVPHTVSPRPLAALPLCALSPSVATRTVYSESLRHSFDVRVGAGAPRCGVGAGGARMRAVLCGHGSVLDATPTPHYTLRTLVSFPDYAMQCLRLNRTPRRTALRLTGILCAPHTLGGHPVGVPPGARRPGSWRPQGLPFGAGPRGATTRSVSTSRWNPRSSSHFDFLSGHGQQPEASSQRKVYRLAQDPRHVPASL